MLMRKKIRCFDKDLSAALRKALRKDIHASPILSAELKSIRGSAAADSETELERDFIGCDGLTVEYVKIIFSEERNVILDGDPGGITGEVLLVEKGTHRFQLDGPQDYTPRWRQPVVKNTTFASPMEVSFEKV